MHFDVGMPGVVGVTVRQEIQATGTRRFDDADVLLRLFPHVHGTELDVRVLHGTVRALANGDFLVGRAAKLLSASSRMWVM